MGERGTDAGEKEKEEQKRKRKRRRREERVEEEGKIRQETKRGN